MADATVYDADSDVSYHPHSDPASGAVGWQAINHSTGRVEYVMLNPSGGSDDGVATVFVYVGETGDPAIDGAEVHLALFTAGRALVEPPERASMSGQGYDAQMTEITRAIGIRGESGTVKEFAARLGIGESRTGDILRAMYEAKTEWLVREKVGRSYVYGPRP